MQESSSQQPGLTQQNASELLGALGIEISPEDWRSHVQIASGLLELEADRAAQGADRVTYQAGIKQYGRLALQRTIAQRPSDHTVIG